MLSAAVPLWGSAGKSCGPRPTLVTIRALRHDRPWGGIDALAGRALDLAAARLGAGPRYAGDRARPRRLSLRLSRLPDDVSAGSGRRAATGRVQRHQHDVPPRHA